ncbi:transcriptional regulator with XRE-family HTH domain/tetratricopeptide (TPR) repeat protein [Streptomyces aurantiacus]|uniref:ATP-binding protein n=1 Tax=Streptomyces aurantiacus TaxID=47760 RepID=UPI0027936C4C|nr:helix-turn-helix domain-containing protein [Streptomyces aurantiacus]MDQ0774034.1 transcriptional regulator with XRE-family HTH domain/tetratricopeptide (TPR) repeat protein [Streptomyces aurantiacus]
MTGGDEAFGAALRELRVAASLTLEGLAEASGVSVRGIGDLERGRRAAPQRRTVAALADGLGLGEAQRERLLAVARAGRTTGYSPAGVRALPRGIVDFVGRTREMASLTELAESAVARLGTAKDAGQVAVAVSGPPGTGKTALALHAARELAGRFPDGQLVVDLRGMDDEPPGPAELMLTVLKALQVADRDLAKAGPQGHPGLYRHLLAERRCLLVLDNARDEAQVRPLLPGAGAGMVVVTSRRMLTGLDSVQWLPLGELTPTEAAAFLTGLVGAERAAADPASLAEVARLCGHLPLALRVAGNWLATRTGWSVRRLADRLALEDRRLDALSTGDIGVSAAFDLSYRQLTPTAARMFRRLSLIAGPDAGVAAAARLTGQELFDAEDTLEELVEAGLLGSDGERYRLHDLLCLFARTRLVADESAEAVGRAAAALDDWLLETTIVAGRWFEPGHGAPPVDWRGPVDLSSADLARRWLKTEGVNWLAALRTAAAAGEHATVVEVAEALHWFSDQWISWVHWPEVFGTAAESAHALGDSLLEATQLNYHAWALLVCEGRLHDSVARAGQALAAARRAGDLLQEAWAHQYRAWALRKIGDHVTSGKDIVKAAELFEAAGDMHGSLQCMHNHALSLMAQGRSEEALVSYRRTHAFLWQAGDRVNPHIADITRFELHCNMGVAYAQLKQWDDALVHLWTAVRMCHDTGNTSLESRRLIDLGGVLLDAGRSAEAQDVYARVLTLGADADPRAVTEARERLDGLRDA